MDLNQKDDWNLVKRIADIKVTDWQIKLDPRSKKLALEFWEWPEGNILEPPTKARTEEDEAAYGELRQLTIGKEPRFSADQRSKTRMVLELPASRTGH